MTLKPLLPLHATLLAIGAFLMSSCEKPQSRSEQVTPPDRDPNVISDVNDSSKSKSVEEEKPKEPEDALLDVKMTPGKIVVSGALKSRIQIARIEEDLKRAFPKLTIQNDLELEFHRYPVGWGNRVSADLLVPYFQQVKEGRVRYEKGIVLLEGSVKTGEFTSR